jgi:hypothetical protein
LLHHLIFYPESFPSDLISISYNINNLRLQLLKYHPYFFKIPTI